MRKLIPIIILLALAVSCGRRGSKAEVVTAPEVVAKDTVYPLGFCTDSFTVRRGTVAGGQTFSALLSSLGMSSAQGYALLQASDSVFDVRKLRAGNGWEAYYSDSSALNYLVYQESRTNSVVFRCTDSLSAWRYQKPIETQRHTADVTITSSLWNDMISAVGSPMLALELSDVYAWTVDFFGLQKGDRFRVIYEEERCDGELIRISRILFAVFSRDGKELPAIWLDQGDGGNCFWNEKGESMRKAFLKAPLQFKRISSGFSYHRVHPVHGTVRAHTGVDYAAPTGTPVMSIGDGTVLSVGWGSGGAGNTVKIRHNSVYTTAYLHLSKFASGLKAGDRVRQGQVIGYVGMTGTATGPHLDFRVWKNGTPINPLTMESPSEEPIGSEFLPALDSLYRMYSASLASE